jgi:hypothetical protein
MDLDKMHAWPIALGQQAMEEQEPLEYHESTTASLAERCASFASEWGSDKVASITEPSLLFKDPEAHPLVLAMMVLDRYGPEALEWAPEVLRVTMMRDNLQVSGASFAKIMAVQVILSSPSPWRQWNVFHWMARALAGLPPNFVFLEQPELGHLFVCADVMAICDPKRQTTVEVDKFVAAALRHEGHVWAPESLAFATRALEEPQLECSTCQALFEDNNDQKCISCGATTLHKVPYHYAALRDECIALWKPRRALPLERTVDGLPESAAGNLVYDVALHWDHAQRVRKQLLAQMRGLAK